MSDTTVSRIWASWQNRRQQRFSRRLGASQIGRPCERELWYSFRWALTPVWEGRMLRLFEKGQKEEEWICEDLKAIGINFLPLDVDTGKQFEFSCLGDHFVSKLDGMALGLVEDPTTWHVCEFKTSAEKAYTKIVKEGVMTAKPEHYAQMQAGMGLSGSGAACYIIVNKNNDDIHMERVAFDPDCFSWIQGRAKSVIFGLGAPEKLNESPAWYQCKFCHYASICHDMGGIAEKNCRTCKFSEPIEEGGWGCHNYSKVLTDDDQKTGCDAHEHHEDMVCPSVVKAQKMFDATIEKHESVKRAIQLEDDQIAF